MQVAAEESYEQQQQRQQAFQSLRPVCARLLQLRNSPDELHAALQQLAHVLQSVGPAGLQGCWDCASFPLLLLLDSVQQSRQEGAAAAPGQLPVPAAKSDRVAEAALRCIKILHISCYCQDQDQLLTALQRLIPLLQLPPATSTEELRLQSFQSVAALLRGAQADPTARLAAEVLKEVAVTPVVGVLLQSCLAAAQQEVAAGGGGSKELRAAALQTLCLVVQVVGSADALAFFVPGLISGLAKELWTSSGAGASAAKLGAAASSAAVIAALQALVAVATTCLGNDVAGPLLGDTGSSQAGSSSGGRPASAQEALQALQQLSLSAAARPDAVAASPAVAASSAASSSTSSAAAAAARLSSSSAAGGPPPTDPSSLRVAITAEWITDAAGKVSTLLSKALPPLAMHARPAVRQALAQAAMTLLEKCDLALKESVRPLMELLLTLAQDEWPQVASACAQWLAAGGHQGKASSASSSSGVSTRTSAPVTSSAGAVSSTSAVTSTDQSPSSSAAAHGSSSTQNGSSAKANATAGASTQPTAPATSSSQSPDSSADLWPKLGPILQDLISGLFKAARAGDGPGTLHARRLSTALLVAGHQAASLHLLQRPALLTQLLQGLLRSFTFERSGASLLLHAQLQGGAYAMVSSLEDGTGAAVPAALQLAGGDVKQVQGQEQGQQDLFKLLQQQEQQQKAAKPLVRLLEADAADAADAAAAPSTPSPQPAPPHSPSTALSTPSPPPAAAAAAAQPPIKRPTEAGPALAAPQLPRMPVNLAYIASGRSYQAVAGVARALGHLARLADLDAAWAVSAGQSRSNLRRVVDELVSELSSRLAAGDASSQQVVVAGSGSSSSSMPLEAASVVVALMEVLYGASAAWSSPLTAATAGAAATATAAAGAADTAAGAAAAAPTKPATPDQNFELVCVAATEALSAASLWSLHTQQPTASQQQQQDPHRQQQQQGQQGAAQPLSAQQLGEHALALRVLLDAVGSLAVVLGPRFAANGRVLRPLLMPLLERLGDPCAFVAAAAGGAAAVVCLHCGYPSLSSLIQANSDYVVDGVCRQLRDLERHPRAPHMLAALLRKARCGPELLPLLAEPARAALQGLSILARRKQPQYIGAFLQALQEIAYGAGEEGRQLAEAAAQDHQHYLALAQQLNAQLDAARQAQEEAEELAALEAELGDVQPGLRAAQYFLRRAARKARDAGLSGVKLEGGGAQGSVDSSGAAQGRDGLADVQEVQGKGEGEEEGELVKLLKGDTGAGGGLDGEHGGGGGGGDGDDASEASAGPAKVMISSEEEEALEQRFRRVHSAAVLAGAAADVAGPLLASSNLHSALAAMHVCSATLAALAATSSALDADKQVEEEMVEAQRAQVKPVRPESPKLLPLVHQLWPHLLAALRDARMPLVERALALLSQMTLAAGGQFMVRRIKQDAWPLLVRLVKDGTCHVSRATLTALPQDEPLAPAAVQRVRLAVMACLADVAGDEGASSAVQPLAWSLGCLAVQFLGDEQPGVMREAATRLLLATAGVDPDAMWLLLVDVVANGQEQQQEQRAQSGGAAGGGRAGAALSGGVNFAQAPPAGCKRWDEMLPRMKAAGAKVSPRVSSGGGSGRAGGRAAAEVVVQGGEFAVTAEMARGCGQRAQLLLQQVEGMKCGWQDSVALLLGEERSG